MGQSHLFFFLFFFPFFYFLNIFFPVFLHFLLNFFLTQTSIRRGRERTYRRGQVIKLMLTSVVFVGRTRAWIGHVVWYRERGSSSDGRLSVDFNKLEERRDAMLKDREKKELWK